MQLQRLKTQPQFQAVLACTPLARTEHFIMHRMDLLTSVDEATRPFAGHGLWLGAMVPKRWARRAVTRNLIKRQIYSIAGQKLADAQEAAYLVRLRAAYDRVRFRSAASDALQAAVRAEIEQLFAKPVPGRKVPS